MIKSSEPRTIGNFTIGKVIGSGSFGKVRQGIHIPTQQKVAVKLLQKKKITSIKDIERIRKQLQILKNLTHPNILKLIEVKQTQKYIAIFTQIVQGQELYDLIVRKGKLQIDEAHKYFCQLFQAVRFLHERKIAHRDIKPQNIIVGRNGELKLIDFGLSTEWENGKTMMQTPCGSPCYAAPEMVLGKKYDTRKVDIWATGVTLYAMLVGRLPFQHDNTLQLYKMITTTQIQEVKDVPSYVNLLLKAMIQKDPKKRISIKSLSENIWLKDTANKSKSTSSNPQYNQQILEQMSQQFNLSIDELKLSMEQNPVSELSTFYYLKSNSISSNIQQQQVHDGPFHLEFVFKSYELIEAYLQKNELKYCWGMNKQPELNKIPQNNEHVSTSKNHITVEEKLFTVKRLKNLPKLIYLPLNGIKLKTKNHTMNFFTKSNERSMTNLDSSRSNLDRLCVETF